jgi:hypothetical protein
VCVGLPAIRQPGRSSCLPRVLELESRQVIRHRTRQPATRQPGNPTPKSRKLKVESGNSWTDHRATGLRDYGTTGPRDHGTTGLRDYGTQRSTTNHGPLTVSVFR